MTTTTHAKEARTPLFHAFHVVETDGEKSRWNRIGVFFAHDDGHGGTLILNSLPLPIAFDGRIVLRTPKTE